MLQRYIVVYHYGVGFRQIVILYVVSYPHVYFKLLSLKYTCQSFSGQAF